MVILIGCTERNTYTSYMSLGAHTLSRRAYRDTDDVRHLRTRRTAPDRGSTGRLHVSKPCIEAAAPIATHREVCYAPLILWTVAYSDV
jgi:hypothetical protein